MACYYHVFPTLVPGPVDLLRALPRFYSVVVTWRAPEQRNGVILGYKLTYSINFTNFVTKNIEVDDYRHHAGVRYVIPSLTPGTEVGAISVAAYNGIGQAFPLPFPSVTTLESEYGI